VISEKGGGEKSLLDGSVRRVHSRKGGPRTKLVTGRNLRVLWGGDLGVKRLALLLRRDTLLRPK